MIKEKNTFMKEALNLARENLRLKNGGPFGAVVVKDGRIIGRGMNSVTAENDPTAHAEINAIREACQNLKSYQLNDCEIYSSCEPCPMCLGAIYWARPSKLYFAATRKDAATAGFEDDMIYEELELPVESRKLPTEQISGIEAREIFEAWIKLESKTMY
jgi:tRNA(Arg) A34 adenosine deaminase TadA